MADEAIIRIVMEGESKGRPAPAPDAAPKQTPPKPPPTPDPNAAGAGAGASPPAGTPPQRDWIKDLIDGIAGANRHVLIEGQSGSGKSVLTRHIAMQRMEQGEEVHVVDPHTPETWGGAASVFQGERAGTEAAKFLRETLEGRKAEASAAKSRGETPAFDDLTVVFSDFARMMKDTPELAEEFRTLLTEARKFRISIVADTTALTSAATGIKGIQDVRQNFAQHVRLNAPTATDPERRAEIGNEEFATPQLPDYKDRIDYGLVKPPAPPPPPPPPDDKELRRAEKEADRAFARKQKEQADFDDAESKWLKSERAQRDKALKDAEDDRRRAEKEADQEFARKQKDQKDLDAAESKWLKAERAQRDKALKAAEDERKQKDKDDSDAEKARSRAEKEADRDFARKQKEQEELDAAEAKWLAAERKQKDKDAKDAENKAREELNARPEAEVYESPEDKARAKYEKKLAKEEERASYEEMYGKEAADEQYGKKKGKGKGGVTDMLAGIGGQMGGGIGKLAGAGAGLMGAVAAGGPAGIVTAALAADQAVKGAVKGTIGGIGGALTAVATTGESPAQTIGKLSDSVEKFGDMIPGVGVIFTALGAAGKVLSGLMESFSKTAESYAEYNPQIAQELAMAEVRRMMGDMRRAQAAGPELAELVRLQSEMQQKFEEIKAKIWEKLLPFLMVTLSSILRYLGVILENTEDDPIMDPTELILQGGRLTWAQREEALDFEGF